MSKRSRNYGIVIPRIRTAVGDLAKYVAHTKQGWSPEQEDELRILSRNHTDEKIAQITGRTYSSIVNKRQKMGIEKIAKHSNSAKPKNTQRVNTLVKQNIIAKPVGEFRDSNDKAVMISLNGGGIADYLNVLLTAHKAGLQVKAL